ncbi:MAG: YihA family ribosome biogenesis GTP-binding protein, partial [Gemmatimonadaceae bacterium]
AGVVLLMDIRRVPSDDDVAMLDFLAELELPAVIVLTKIDKLSRAAAAARADEIMGNLSLLREQIIPFSATTGDGRDELAAAVASLVDIARGPQT